MSSVPHAEVIKDQEFTIGLQTNDVRYKLYDEGNRPQDGDERIYSIGIGFVDRLNLVLNLIRINGSSTEDSIGIGDRSAQLTYLAHKESKTLPAIAINLSVPNLSNEQQFLSGNHVVMSKNFSINEKQIVTSTLGYGIPYLIGGVGADNNRQLTLRDKRSDFLTGFFGGIELELEKKFRGSLEYDGRVWNGELGAIVWERLDLSVYLQGFDRLEYAINYTARIK